jgi:phospholipid/cholesterol/gamma-HCH transport system permease protein
MQNNLKIIDIFGGLLKSFVFGILVSLISTYIGYNTIGGAKGVGNSTTSSVVYSSIIILIANYFVSVFLFKVDL